MSLRSAVTWRRTHLGVGVVAMVIFLVSGAYMRGHDPPMAELEPSVHVMYTSRHIYILAASLIHLMLGSYLRPAASRAATGIQLVGSMILIVAAVLLTAAFVTEAMAGRSRTPVSSFGLYGLFAGTLLHVVSGWRQAPDS